MSDKLKPTCCVLGCQKRSSFNDGNFICRFHWQSLPRRLKRSIRKAERKQKWDQARRLWFRADDLLFVLDTGVTDRPRRAFHVNDLALGPE